MPDPHKSERMKALWASPEFRARVKAAREARHPKKMKVPPLVIEPEYCPKCLEQIIRGECWCENKIREF